MEKAKPFSISKRAVVEAYRRVKLNKGKEGVDGETIEGFEKDLENNLYKLWNRMSSGSYFPPPVRRVEIPKRGDSSGKRPLGIPTVSDRMAQMVCRMYLEPELERHFHPDSYAYRPEKSAKEAVGKARQRCFRNNWALDMDIKSFFDSIDHELLMRAVGHHTECKWVLLYISRWLRAPIQMPDGTLKSREKGTPQGSVISPVLANLFLHYAFDKWMERQFPTIPFERYADDVICHCKSEAQAKSLREEVEKRLAECGLELHPRKTKIVYCKDDRRPGNYENESFDFLGFTFRPRLATDRQKKRFFVGFLPAVSNEAAKAMRQTIRSWELHLRSGTTLNDLAREINPTVRGWINYYGSYYRSALGPLIDYLDQKLVKWATRKYKKLRRRPGKAFRWLRRIQRRQPRLFAHWTPIFAKAGR